LALHGEGLSQIKPIAESFDISEHHRIKVVHNHWCVELQFQDWKNHGGNENESWRISSPLRRETKDLAL
jgi:hypothetical protein